MLNPKATNYHSALLVYISTELCVFILIGMLCVIQFEQLFIYLNLWPKPMTVCPTNTSCEALTRCDKVIAWVRTDCVSLSVCQFM